VLQILYSSTNVNSVRKSRKMGPRRRRRRKKKTKRSS